MTREHFAATIRWSWIIWIAGFTNVGAMLPQLWTILSTKKVEGVSVTMFIIYALIQIAFALEGFFKRNRALMVSMTLSAVVTASIVSLVFYYRV